MSPKFFIFSLMSFHVIAGCIGGNEMCKVASGRRRACHSPPWIQWGGKCYQAVMEELTWFEAKDECVQMGGVLVVPQSDEETGFLLLLTQSDFWVNCNDLRKEGTWVCLDGVDEVEYRNWEVRNYLQPDNYGGNENCAEVYSVFGTWNDLPCEMKLLAICSHATSIHHGCTSAPDK
ncbi:asialoglycoprotein receptor 2-like [Acanthaster planci]|uniref:Asialoglycoprotein receptor 2-like n=1 Tax=Acanthaster planci TaxID=133434 RepID=A0A8B7YRK5_ACAPL|nr:asialoglycoprotein receptor 2-like [Acanthaster planci]